MPDFLHWRSTAAASESGAAAYDTQKALRELIQLFEPYEAPRSDAPPSQELTCSIMVKRQSLVLQFRSFTAESPVGCTNERRMFASKVPIAITTRPYLRQTRRHRLAMRRTGHARSTVKRLRSTSERQAYIADQPPLTVEERMARGCPDCTAAECVDSSTRLRPIALAR